MRHKFSMFMAAMALASLSAAPAVAQKPERVGSVMTRESDIKGQGVAVLLSLVGLAAVLIFTLNEGDEEAPDSN